MTATAARVQFTPDLAKQAAAARAIRAGLAAYGDEGLVLDTIEGETTLFEDIDRLLLAITETRGLIAGADEVIGEMQARRERFQDRLDALRSVIEQGVSIAEISGKIERPIATIFLSARAPKLVCHTEADIPADYWKAADPVLDRSKLIAALKDGQEVPGASLSNAAPSLSMRFK